MRKKIGGFVDSGNLNENPGVKVKTSLRMNYEAQVEVVKKQIGDLEDVRRSLGLSQRKMAQLLLVDPSAWTRWTQKNQQAPPHIYRALQWFVSLQGQIPGLNASYFLQKDTQHIENKVLACMEQKSSEIEHKHKEISHEVKIMLTEMDEKLKSRAQSIVEHSSKGILSLEEEVQRLSQDFRDSQKQLGEALLKYQQLQSKIRNLFISVLCLLGILCVFFFSFKAGAEELPAEKSKNILLPIAYYTPDTSLAYGVLGIFNFEKTAEGKTNHVSVVASYTLNNQSIFMVNPWYYWDEGRKLVTSEFRFSLYPNRYYGDHFENSNDVDREKYTEKFFTALNEIGFIAYSKLWLKGLLSLDQRRFVDVIEAPKLSEQLRSDFFTNLGLGLGFEWDERDYPQAPRNGFLARLALTQFQMIAGDFGADLADSTEGERARLSARRNFFSNLGIDEQQKRFSYLRKDLEFKDYRSFDEVIIASHFYFSTIEGVYVPHYLKNYFGGGKYLRGYNQGRFRDKNSLVIQTEARFEKPANPWIPVIFAGVGVLSDQTDRLLRQPWIGSAGFGVHYLIDPLNRKKLRIEAAYGEEFNLYFLMNEAF